MAGKIVQSKGRFSLPAIGGFLLAVAVGLAAVTSGVGSYWEWWSFRPGFVSSMGRLWRDPGRRYFPHRLPFDPAGCCPTRFYLVRLRVADRPFDRYYPWSHWRLAQSVPPIHDITTDTENPPGFVSSYCCGRTPIRPFTEDGMWPPNNGPPIRILPLWFFPFRRIRSLNGP